MYNVFLKSFFFSSFFLGRHRLCIWMCVCAFVCQCSGIVKNNSMKAFAYITIKCANGKKIQNGCWSETRFSMWPYIKSGKKRKRFSAEKNWISMSNSCGMRVDENAFYQNAIAMMYVCPSSRWGRFFFSLSSNAVWETNMQCTCHSVCIRTLNR